MRITLRPFGVLRTMACENHTSFFRGAAHDGTSAVWSTGFSPKSGFPCAPIHEVSRLLVVLSTDVDLLARRLLELSQD